MLTFDMIYLLLYSGFS